MIKPANMNTTGTNILSQTEPGSNGNEEVLSISQSSRTEASPSDCLVSHSYLPTPPLGQDMTQGQFLSGV